MEFIIITLICFIVFSFGVNVGWHLRERAAKRVVDKFMEEFQNIQPDEEEFINISIEKHNNTYYVYNKDDNSFMGQAVDRIELEKVLAERFPGKRFMADGSNLKEVGFK